MSAALTPLGDLRVEASGRVNWFCQVCKCSGWGFLDRERAGRALRRHLNTTTHRLALRCAFEEVRE